MVDNVLTTAAAQNLNTMRTWGFIDVGNQDGPNSVDGPHNGVYFHYWDGSAPAFNDVDTGLKHLDYVIYKASQLNIKLVIPFVNNYDQFGGMDQYVRWKGGQYHDQFYSDPTIRQWYKDWITHLLNHTNAYSGIQYKDDPTILSWELANEERCAGYGVYPSQAIAIPIRLPVGPPTSAHLLRALIVNTFCLPATRASTVPIPVHPTSPSTAVKAWIQSPSPSCRTWTSFRTTFIPIRGGRRPSGARSGFDATSKTRVVLATVPWPASGDCSTKTPATRLSRLGR